MKTIRIGTRDSRLAIWQAEWVKHLLKKKNPNIEFVLAPRKTKGDQILDLPLPKIGDKGLFTKELEQGLLGNEIDMAVHSLKDLPAELPEGLVIAAFCKRHDPRDVLLSKEGIPLGELPEGSVIGTSSPRRTTQLRCYRQDLVFTDLRGNLETRWRKLQESPSMAGMVLAAAGVIRLGWEDRITEYISEDIVLPAAGQGVIAVEIAADRADMRELVGTINHRPTELTARAERSFLKSLQGGCQFPLGALANLQGDVIGLKAMIASLDSSVILQAFADGSDPEAVGAEAADRILLMGAGEILAEIRNTTERGNKVNNR
jgi:hydroxymethylbilane synthase